MTKKKADPKRTTAKTTTWNKPARQRPAAASPPPPPTAKSPALSEAELADRQWLADLEATLSFDPGCLSLADTLDENGFDFLDVVDFAMWIEDRYGISFDIDDELETVLQETLADLKTRAEKIAKVRPKR